jgi:hypothetical protein
MAGPPRGDKQEAAQTRAATFTLLGQQGGSLMEIELPPGACIPTLIPGMTLVIGLPGKDCCVVVADTQALISDRTTRDGEEKIRQIGGNCVVGLSDDADVSLRILKQTGWFQRQEQVDALIEAESLARAFRLHRLGDTTIPSWWMQPCPQESALGKHWGESPCLGAMVVGFSGKRPVVVSIDQKAAHACHVPDYPVPIGITYWAHAILNDHFPRDSRLRTEADLIYLGVLCLAATSKFTRLVNNDPRVVVVREGRVETLDDDAMRPYAERAEKTLQDWGSAITTQLGAASSLPVQGDASGLSV